MLPLLLLSLLGFNAPAQAQSDSDYVTVENPPVYTGADSLGGSAASARAATAATLLSALSAADRSPRINLNVGYVNTFIWNPTDRRYDRVRLRSYHGVSNLPPIAPTIVVQPGRTLNIRLNNNLPADDPSCANRGADSHNTPGCFNDTNLHTHGLWVDPTGISDNVFLTVKPGQSQDYSIHIPSDHPSGTFWYHAHVHGSTALQVSSGMAGALIVRGNRQPTAERNGDIDTLLRSTSRVPVSERVLMFQQIQYNCVNEEGAIRKKENGHWSCVDGDVGRLEDYKGFGPEEWRNSGRFTTINGRTLPLFVGARAGRLERWRMIHGGVRDTINLEFKEVILSPGQPMPDFRRMNATQLRNFVNNNCNGAPLHQHLVAADGLTNYRMLRTTQSVFQPGYRWDALMMFPRAGYYCVIDSSTTVAGSVNVIPAQQLLGVVRVSAGETMQNVDVPARVKQKLLSLANSNAPAALREEIVADLNDNLKLTRYMPHKDIPDSELTEDRQTLTFNISGADDTFRFEVDGKSYQPGVMGRLLKLGGVQEWHLKSDVVAHPYHIHVNPFQIVSILDPSGRDVSGLDAPDNLEGQVDPQYRGLKGLWKDTIMVKAGKNGSSAEGQYTVVVRTRYERFAGDFVLHCHILDHEDQGMMEHVRIWDPANPATRDAPVPGHSDHAGH